MISAPIPSVTACGGGTAGFVGSLFEGSGRRRLIEGVEPRHDIRNVVLFDRAALVVQAETVGAHVVEPDFVRAAVSGFGEDQNGGGYACIGFEYAGGHGNYGLQAVVFNQFLADGLVRVGGAKEHAVRHDAGAAPAYFEHPQKQREKQKLGLFRFADFEQVGGDDVVVQTALERGVGKNQRVFFFVRILVREAVAVRNQGVVDAVGHHVHGADAQHGAIHVEAVKHAVHVVVFVLAAEENRLLAVFFEVVTHRHKKAGGATGRVADNFVRFGSH